MIINRVEQHIIRRSNPVWKTVDRNCFYSKNMYNYANYIIRQEFINNGRWIRYNELAGSLKSSDLYKELMSQPAQQTLSVLDKAWKSCFNAIKEWKKNSERFLGRPKLPGYKPKDGRFPWYIKNNTSYIKDGVLHFQVKRLHGITFPTKAKGCLLGVRFIPRGSCYVMEIVTEVEIPDFEEKPMTRIAGIDLGIDNFATISNNIGVQPIIINGKGLKSVNQFYNKCRAEIQSDLMLRHGKRTSRALEELIFKRFCRVKTFMHAASRKTVNYCLEYGIDALVCGLNKEWKQEISIGKRNNQKFCSIPYDMFVRQLAYKCEEVGIRFLTTEESYTSGTSFLDGEPPTKEFYNKKRRIHRGLFRSDNGLINADVNGAMQIIRKVSENAFDGYSVGAAGLQPLMWNAAYAAGSSRNVY